MERILKLDNVELYNGYACFGKYAITLEFITNSTSDFSIIRKYVKEIKYRSTAKEVAAELRNLADKIESDENLIY